jgi:hypothetical protein
VTDPASRRFRFAGELWHWRGPAPYHFITVPPDDCAMIKSVASSVTYGWGMIPVSGRIGSTEFETSLWPKDGRYLLPIRDAVRLAEELSLGDVVQVDLSLRGPASAPARTDADVEYDMDRGPADP